MVYLYLMFIDLQPLNLSFFSYSLDIDVVLNVFMYSYYIFYF